MFVFMTTANYPDVMLPAYRRNRATALFFISYEILVLFLFLRLLLAIFYSNYQQKTEESND
jgi:two pore calcium channel protein 1